MCLIRIKKLENIKGFTIIETMIFLAISGVMFLMAASFINGKEAQAEFEQGMNQTNAKITSIIDNVSDGNYPFPVNEHISCSLSGNVPHFSLSATTSIDPGCDLIGEYLAPENNGNSSQYSLYTVAGCEYNSDSVGDCSSSINLPPATLADEHPTVVKLMSGSNMWPDGLEINNMFADINGTSSPIGGVGFFSSLANNNDGVLSSGSTYVMRVLLTGSSLKHDSSTTVINDINSIGTSTLGPSGNFMDSGYVVMCFQGSNGDIGSINISIPYGGGQVISTLQLGNNVSHLC